MIKVVESRRYAGRKSYFFTDHHISLVVFPNGDYVKMDRGGHSFGTVGHSKLIEFANPTGEDVTVQEWIKTKTKRKK